MDDFRKRFPESAVFTASARIINSDETDRFVAKASLQPLKGLLPSWVNPEDNPDLLYIASNGAAAGLCNRNGDAIDPETAVRVHRSAASKFISIEHDRENVVGVVLYPGLTRFGTNEPITDEQAAQLKEPFNLAFAGALWKVIDGRLARYIRKVDGALDEDALSISWEILISEWCIGVGSKNAWDCRRVLPGDPQFDDLVPRLKAKGGSGKSLAGEDIFRIITGDAIILGYSIVAAPAAEVKGILPIVAAPVAAQPVAAEPASAGTATQAALEPTLQTVEPLPLADGTYSALRYGYTLEIGGKEYATKDGVRCGRDAALKLDVTVSGAGGQVTFSYAPVATSSASTDTPATSDTTPAATPLAAPTPPPPAVPAQGLLESLATEKIITPTESRVTPHNAPMKIESFDQLIAQWSELSKQDAAVAVASIEAFRASFDKANEKYLSDLNAQTDLAKSLEQAKASAEAKAAELEASLAKVNTQLTALQTAAVAAEQDRKFQERMASFDEEYTLDDEDRQILASDIKVLSDEAFAAYQKKCAKLMCAKKKGVASASVTPAAVVVPAAAAITQAFASVTETPGQAVVPPGQMAKDATLSDEMDEAFGSAIRVGGKTIKDRRAEKAAKAPKE